MPAVMERVGRRAKLGNPVSGGGGGGADLGKWKNWGDGGKGGYQKEISQFDKMRGPVTALTNKFKQDIGDPFQKNKLWTSQEAGRAKAFAETQVPKLIENAQKVYDGFVTASNGDVDIKKAQVKMMMKHSSNLTKQFEQDHIFARHQLWEEVAKATIRWETNEVYLESQGALEQLRQDTAALAG